MPARAPANQRGDRLAAWLVVPLVAVLAILLVLFYGIFSNSTVDGPSMLPTLKPGDKMLLTRGYDTPVRGDIVVIHLFDRQGRPHDIVKRVVGLPGDTVVVRRETATVNGAAELSHTAIVDPNDPEVFAPVKVPAGSVYVMGDNRPVSLDSRYIGTIPLADVQGRVEAIWAPINRVRRIN